MRTRIGPVGAAWCVVGVLVLTGCTSDTERRKVTLDAPTESGAVAPEQVADGDPVPEEGTLTRAGNAATTPREQAVAEAWFDYLEEMVRMLGTPDSSPFRMRELAVGGGADGPQRYAEELEEKGIRLAGGMVASVLDVDLEGDRATVDGCAYSTMIEVDAQGRPLEEHSPWFRATNTLTWDGERWLVSSNLIEKSPKCV